MIFKRFNGKLILGFFWVGIYQTNNNRNNNLVGISSKSHYDGWLLIPHLEVDVPFRMRSDKITVCPFARIDWPNNWQDNFEETGSSGLNLVFDDQYVSMLRSEVGLRLFESFDFKHGKVVLEQKGSYVNKAPFNSNAVTTTFVSSVSDFSIEVFSNQVQNLGSLQLSAYMLPCKAKYPYFQVNYLLELGSGFIMNGLSFEIGKQF